MALALGTGFFWGLGMAREAAWGLAVVLSWGLLGVAARRLVVWWLARGGCARVNRAPGRVPAGSLLPPPPDADPSASARPGFIIARDLRMAFREKQR